LLLKNTSFEKDLTGSKKISEIQEATKPEVAEVLESRPFSERDVYDIKKDRYGDVYARGYAYDPDQHEQSYQ
jgi:hypothetical protein